MIDEEEIVAIAMFDAVKGDDKWENYSEDSHTREYWRKLAKAAIETINRCRHAKSC